MYVPLQPALEPILDRTGWPTSETFIESLTDKKRIPWKDREARVAAGTLSRDAEVFSQSLFPVATDLAQGDVYHASYLRYLNFCYANHLNVVLRPDDIWYVLLTQLAEIVKDDPPKYAHLFTTTPEKKQTILLSIEGKPMWEMPLFELFDVLKSLVPTDGAAFTPSFSTTTADVQLAEIAAFADMVSPYYDYGTFRCGLPGVHVEGTVEDWRKLAQSWTTLCDLFFPEVASLDVDPVLKWMSCVEALLIRTITDRDDAGFWKNIFGWERCGSGSENEVTGWFRQLFWKQPDFPAKITNFATCVARVNYKNLTINQKFTMFRGCFSSTLQEGCILRPHYNFVACEQRETPEEIVQQRPPIRIESFNIGKGNKGETTVTGIPAADFFGPLSQPPLGAAVGDIKRLRKADFR